MINTKKCKVLVSELKKILGYRIEGIGSRSLSSSRL